MLRYHNIRDGITQIVTSSIEDSIRGDVEMRLTDFFDNNAIDYGTVNNSIFVNTNDFNAHKLQIGRIMIIKLQTLEHA